MSTNKIKQHYVPQFHLRRFSRNRESIYVYDKISRKVYEAAIKDVAQERYFYNIAEEFITDDVKSKGFSTQVADDAFTKIEDVFKEPLNDFVRNPKAAIQDYEIRFEIAQYIVIQILRTKETRDFIVEAETKIRQKWTDHYLKRERPDISENEYPQVELNQSHISLLHAQYALDVDAWERLGRELCQQIWMIADNRTAKLLYTSDQPIIKQVMTNALGGPERRFYSMRMFYPITPTKGILIFDKDYYQPLKQFDGKTYVLSGKDIANYNKEQVIQSHRQIYSFDGDFAVAEDTCNAHPEICSPITEKADIGTYYSKTSKDRVEEMFVIQPIKHKIGKT
jgi:hypothetical protein